MPYNPEKDGANSYSAEIAVWQPIINANKAALAANQARHEIQRSRNISAAYESDLVQARKEHKNEIELLKLDHNTEAAENEAELARKEFELSLKNLDIAKLNFEVTENKMSSYNYKFDRDALCVAIEEKFGESVRNELIADMNEIAAEFREDDAEEGFPRLESHRLWGSK